MKIKITPNNIKQVFGILKKQIGSKSITLVTKYHHKNRWINFSNKQRISQPILELELNFSFQKTNFIRIRDVNYTCAFLIKETDEIEFKGNVILVKHKHPTIKGVKCIDIINLSDNSN